MSLTRLLELHDLAKKKCRSYRRKRRLAFELERDKGRHFIGITGARGTGKTILLQQYAREHDKAFYLSADTLDKNDDIWSLILMLNRNLGFQTFLIDEIHFFSDAAALLKRIYDFLDIKIIFSSSVALAMRESAHDLSRRVRLLELHSFSFREYLAFAHSVDLPSISLQEIIDARWMPDHLLQGHHFDAYLQGGILPFSLEESAPLVFLESILQKVVQRDLPTVNRLMVDELDTIQRLIRFIGRSGIDGINYSCLSRNLGITKYKAEQYIDLLERAFILHRIFPAGTNVLREPKIVMIPPNRLLYRDWADALGGHREDFFVEALTQAGINLHYLKSTRGEKTPDYLVEYNGRALAVEIGGRGKGRQQFKGVDVDHKLVFSHIPLPENRRLPLFLLGFLS